MIARVATAPRAALLRTAPVVAVPLLASSGLLLLFLGQWRLAPPDISRSTAFLLVAGLVVWGSAVAMAGGGRATTGQAVVTGGAVRRFPLAVSIAMGLVAWVGSSSGVWTPTNVSAWIVAGVLWCFAWWPRDAPPYVSLRGVRAAVRRHAWLLLALAAIVAVGAFYRFYHLGAVPSEPTGDHVEKLLDMHDIETGARPVFLDRNGGREPAQFYFTYGVLMKLLGFRLSFETLKEGTAFIGLLGIPAVFLFAREVAGRATGLFAALLFAISAWPAGTARVGVRFPFGPLATALALWLLLRYIRRGDRRDALLCGVAVGLGLHGYTAFRIVPVLVPVLLGLAWLYRRRAPRPPAWPSPVAGTALILSTGVLACIPLAHYAIAHPDRVSARTRATLLKDNALPAVHWNDVLPRFFDNTWNALLAFNWRGDPEGLMNAVLEAPFLDAFTGAALLAGLVVVGYDALVRRSFQAAALLASIPFLLLPSTLMLAVPHQNPSVSRLGALAPVVFVIAARPFALLWESLRLRTARGDPWWSIGRARAPALLAAAALVAIGLGIAAVQNYDRYFHDYARQYTAFMPPVHEVAAAMQTREHQGVALDDMYILGYPYWVDARLVGFALDEPDWAATHNPVPSDPLPDAAEGRPLLYVLNRADRGRRRELSTRYPGGSFALVDVPGHEFLLYQVPPS